MLKTGLGCTPTKVFAQYGHYTHSSAYLKWNQSPCVFLMVHVLSQWYKELLSKSLRGRGWGRYAISSITPVCGRGLILD